MSVGFGNGEAMAPGHEHCRWDREDQSLAERDEEILKAKKRNDRYFAACVMQVIREMRCRLENV